MHPSVDDRFLVNVVITSERTRLLSNFIFRSKDNDWATKESLLLPQEIIHRRHDPDIHELSLVQRARNGVLQVCEHNRTFFSYKIKRSWPNGKVNSFYFIEVYDQRITTCIIYQNLPCYVFCIYNYIVFLYSNRHCWKRQHGRMGTMLVRSKVHLDYSVKIVGPTAAVPKLLDSFMMSRRMVIKHSSFDNENVMVCCLYFTEIFNVRYNFRLSSCTSLKTNRTRCIANLV